ncbi:hypothetical protein HQ393_01940 [Chitinibacter bivalviorum]|uniref:Uncharacterized protein n=1 Tax=Chitinibacter bivalviorum TaxID=2739434 RepID=A0A7H9BHT5_9NEIS|nr:hypothetical protein [Chitinibacter bivalviorum]QLG87104.1 hypothetical protein HQ393_01940 [Chitinibacter bivalviorum]
MTTPFSHLNLTCHAKKSCAPCDCSDAEIAVRHFASPKHSLGYMDDAQRNWCTEEILRFMPDESATWLNQLQDDELARKVLKSWSFSVRF